jgi:hypothetical protein
MTDELLREGGPHRVRKSGPDEYSLSISLPTDEDGLLGRECPVDTCSPGYFKVKPGTGLTGQALAYCPYCGNAAKPSGFASDAKAAYAKGVVEREALQGVDRMLRSALGLGPSGKRQLASGIISVELAMQPMRLPAVGRPLEEELQRDIQCEYCGLVHAVFGLATWCPDCGRDVFMAHVKAELEVLRKILLAVKSRKESLGPRVAARDVENSLEDLVSVCEAVLKAVIRRHLLSLGKAEATIIEFLDGEVRNGFQNLPRARKLLLEHTGATLGRGIGDDAFDSLATVLEKRHPIAHNLGVVDRKYLARARSAAGEGREVLVTPEEVSRAIDLMESCFADLCHQLFPRVAQLPP